ncbi:Gamma-irradiation and mitomycin c induced 1-like protein [Theobroma cacao]|uniref:Gamma-irradiation and mitomycin c induced 1-like protein n=1 Tax=Theobroma cacao TaxID=3641 RepID=A0A061G2A5_THECC|nr:Gamma-irradiation and mitomycin c induced 1-like protein [Theobroma cacao]
MFKGFYEALFCDNAALFGHVWIWRTYGIYASRETDGGIRDASEDEIRNLLMRALQSCNMELLDGRSQSCHRWHDAGGRAAITNLLSCSGPEFTILLHFSLKRENVATKGSKASEGTNARLKCIYFPIHQGKENIERILEKLDAEGCGVGDNYENFSCIPISCLGRLLPDARWNMIQENSFLVAETDAGFNPTPLKTDLVHHNPFSIALKNFGCRHVEKEKDVDVEICRGGKQLTFLQLEREYQDWLLQMQDSYEKEIRSGADQPVLVVGPLNKKALGISYDGNIIYKQFDVIRVRKILKRKGVLWESGQRINILKGACAGFHKNNEKLVLYAADLLVQLLSKFLDANASFDIRNSLSLPVSVINSGKCLAIDDTDWDCQLEKQCQKAPSRIDLLNVKLCQELKALPADATLQAGLVPPKEIVAVLHPRSFGSSSASNDLDQKEILKINLEMSMEVNFRRTKNHQDVKHIYSGRITPSSCKGFNGLYVFPLGASSHTCFKKQAYIPFYSLLVGSCFPFISIACYDIYDNWMPFSSIPDFKIKLIMNEGLLVDVTKMKPFLSSDKLVLNIEHVMIESNELDSIGPHYAATLMIYSKDESVSISVECQVTPGALRNAKACPEMFDAYGNHVAEGVEVQFHLDGFVIQEHLGSKYKVDDQGCIDRGCLLKVTAGYGKPEHCIAGFILEDLAFEVVDSQNSGLSFNSLDKFCIG